MPFATQDDLVQSVLAWLNREGDTTLQARVPDWIALAEARIRREQNWFHQFYSLANSGNPLTVTAYPMELPNFVRDIITMWNVGSVPGSAGDIEILTPASWRSYVNANPSVGGIPRKAIIVPQMDSWLVDPDGGGATSEHGSQLFLWPQPPTDGTVKIDFEFIRDLDPITVSSVNGLYVRHPDLYLYGTLVESAPYLQHDDRMALWESRFQQAIAEINLERERAQFAASRKRVQLPRSFGG